MDSGAHVHKGERGNLVVYANTITKTEKQDDGSEEDRNRPWREKSRPILTGLAAISLGQTVQMCCPLVPFGFQKGGGSTDG